MSKARTEADQRKNRKRVAKHNALAHDNKEEKKCMMTFASVGCEYEDLVELKNFFIKKLRDKKRNKPFKDGKLSYYGVIEAGEDFDTVPRYHIHFQFYYRDIELMEYAYNILLEHEDCARCEITHPEKTNVKFTYVIKHFYKEHFNPEREAEISKWSKGGNRVFNSRKELPDYLIKRLYWELKKLSSWEKDRDNYPILLDLIKNGIIKVQKITDDNPKPDNYKEIKKWCYLIDWTCVK